MKRRITSADELRLLNETLREGAERYLKQFQREERYDENYL
jgi:hypothetical protein